MPDAGADRIGTRLTDLLGVRYPIVQGGMIWVSGWRLAAAVCGAGALGVIGAGSMTEALLEEHIARLTAVWRGPFGVNFPVSSRAADGFADICAKRRVPVVITSGGSPSRYTSRLKGAGAVVIHVVPSARLAMKVEAAGCDAVVAEGTEAGGHNGFEEITSQVLWPSVVDAVRIPVVAAGGIVDGRGMACALCHGAAGVQVGTRFAATEESSGHPAYKEAIVRSTEAEAILYLRPLAPTRALENAYVSRVEAAARGGAPAEELAVLRGTGRSRRGMFEGDLEEGELEIGQAASRVAALMGAAKVVASMVAEYRAVVSSLPI